MAKDRMTALLRKNRVARKQETVVRETLRDLKRLRKEGFGGKGYTLAFPFGEGRRIYTDDDLASAMRNSE